MNWPQKNAWIARKKTTEVLISAFFVFLRGKGSLIRARHPHLPARVFALRAAPPGFRARAGRRRLPEAALDCGSMPHAANETIVSNFCQARIEGK